MKPHESSRINKKSIRGNSCDSWPVWNRGINKQILIDYPIYIDTINIEEPILYSKGLLVKITRISVPEDCFYLS